MRERDGGVGDVARHHGFVHQAGGLALPEPGPEEADQVDALLHRCRSSGHGHLVARARGVGRGQEPRGHAQRPVALAHPVDESLGVEVGGVGERRIGVVIVGPHPQQVPRHPRVARPGGGPGQPRRQRLARAIARQFHQRVRRPGVVVQCHAARGPHGVIDHQVAQARRRCVARHAVLRQLCDALVHDPREVGPVTQQHARMRALGRAQQVRLGGVEARQPDGGDAAGPLVGIPVGHPQRGVVDRRGGGRGGDQVPCARGHAGHRQGGRVQARRHGCQPLAGPRAGDQESVVEHAHGQQVVRRGRAPVVLRNPGEPREHPHSRHITIRQRPPHHGVGGQVGHPIRRRGAEEMRDQRGRHRHAHVGRARREAEQGHELLRQSDRLRLVHRHARYASLFPGSVECQHVQVRSGVTLRQRRGHYDRQRPLPIAYGGRECARCRGRHPRRGSMRRV